MFCIFEINLRLMPLAAVYNFCDTFINISTGCGLWSPGMDAGLNPPPDVAKHGPLFCTIELTGAKPCIIDILQVLLLVLVCSFALFL